MLTADEGTMVFGILFLVVCFALSLVWKSINDNKREVRAVIANRDKRIEDSRRWNSSMRNVESWRNQ